jgi:serine/threonine protein kinase
MSKAGDYLGETLDGKYRLERLLGRGGMGAVYLATHLGTERFVALKLISPQFMAKDEFVERFRREARAAGRLRHPNVVDVTDFGFAQVADGSRVAYLVMEYLDGCTLADVLEEEKRLSLDWVIDIMEQVCSALDEAHAQGIVHRDLKPDNIWLEPNRLGGYRVKVLDFGIAKLGDAPNLKLPDANAAANNIETTNRTTQDVALSRTLAKENDKTLAFASESLSKNEAAKRRVAASNANEEAATRLLSNSNPDEEAETLILNSAKSNDNHAPSIVKETEANDATSTLALPARDGEEATQIFNVEDAKTREEIGREEAGTRLLPVSIAPPQNISTAHPAATATDSLDSATREVTRVGAIIGTPLYMSPEQCRGETLDARSDIYSLGVIAYQMLAGTTPFAGDLTTIIKQHKFDAPPALREKNGKIPNRTAQIIESALSKEREARPPTATAFASELRASAEGIGSLVRRAFALYSEHFTSFVRISFLAHLPAILIILLQFANDWAAPLLPKWANITFAAILSLALFVVSFLSASVITGMTVLIVAQLTIAPLRPVRLRELFGIFKKRLRAFLTTGILASALILVGFILLVIPGVILFVRYALYAPIVVLENLKNFAALRRSVELMRRARLSVFIVVLIEISIPILAQSIFTSLFGGFAVVREANGLHISPNSKTVQRFSELLNIFIVPMLSILTALLYFKLRQLGGEPMKAIAENLNDDSAMLNNWQRRMRARLTQISNYTR